MSQVLPPLISMGLYKGLVKIEPAYHKCFHGICTHDLWLPQLFLKSRFQFSISTSKPQLLLQRIFSWRDVHIYDVYTPKDLVKFEAEFHAEFVTPRSWLAWQLKATHAFVSSRSTTPFSPHVRKQISSVVFCNLFAFPTAPILSSHNSYAYGTLLV